MTVKVDPIEISVWERDQYAEAFKTYAYYLAIRLHFSEKKFNYAEYGPMPNLKFDTFYKNQGRCKQFAKLARRFSNLEDSVLENYLIANFIKNPKVYVDALCTKNAQANYDDYRRIHENFTYNLLEKFEELVVPLCEERGLKFLDYVKTPGGDGIHTPFYDDIITDKFPVWFLVGLNRVLKIIDAYHTMYADDLWWAGTGNFLKKVDQLVPEQDVSVAKTRLRDLLVSRGLV